MVELQENLDKIPLDNKGLRLATILGYYASKSGNLGGVILESVLYPYIKDVEEDTLIARFREALYEYDITH